MEIRSALIVGVPIRSAKSNVNKWLENRRVGAADVAEKRYETGSHLFGIGDQRLIDEVAKNLCDTLIPPF